MILIETKSKKKFWTDEYDSSGEFLIFSFTTRNGKTYKVNLCKTEIASIIDFGEKKAT